MANHSTRYFDLALSVSIFIAVAIACGRVYRFPFDDEVHTLLVASTLHFSNLPRYIMNDGDVNKPPLSYLLYYAAWSVGVRSAALRWISLGCTAVTLMIWHWLTLCCLDEQIPTPIRLLISLIFGVSPMALGQGDVMRWYPPFALAVAVAFLVYLRSPRRWFLSGIAMGIAADFSFLAMLPFLSLCFHRYVIERKFRLKEEVTFFFLAGLVAIVGFTTFADFVLYDAKVPDLMPGILKRVGATALGFFGGNTLGLSQLWIVTPAVIATAYLACCAAVASAPRQPARRLCSLVLLTAVGPAMFTLSGFAEPRAYLFLTPMISALISIGMVHALGTSPRLGSAAYAALLVCAVAVASNLRRSNSPFKRSIFIPFGEVVDFVRTNRRGSTLILTSDYSMAYLSAGPGVCVAQFYPSDHTWVSAPCTAEKMDTVIVIKGDSLNEDDAVWRNKVARIVLARREVAEAHFGRDDDAYLRNRLSGKHLSQSLIDVAIYR